MNNRNNKNTKRMVLTVLALILMLCMGITGTLAYLTGNSNAVTNTFVAAGSGHVVDPTPGTDAPDVKDEDNNPVTLNDGFFLVESKAVYVDGAYQLGNDKVIKNDYDKVVPGMVIPKDPALTLDIATGADVYVFVKVTDTTNSNLSHSLTSDWTAVEGVTGLYVYKNTIQTGNENVELNAVKILASEEKVTAAATLNIGDNGALGQLTFDAYVCQAGGFDSPAAAYNACFANNG